MITSTWATKYRPRTFSEIVGQSDKVFLYNAAKDVSSCPPVILLCGPSGVGKTTAARIFAAAVNCEADGVDPCGVCASCSAVFSSSHPFVREIDAARHASADDMRLLHNQAHIASSSHSVFILDEVHSVSQQAWNVLLKVLEEPPPSVTFLLLTSEPAKVPMKIMTRSMRLNFPLLSHSQILKKLNEICEMEDIPQHVKENLDLIAEASGGSCRESLMSLEQASKSDPQYLSNVAQFLQAYDLLHFVAIKDTVSAIKLAETMFYRMGSASLVVDFLAAALEKIVLDTFSVSSYHGQLTQTKISQVSGYLDDNKLFKLLEVITNWSPTVSSRVHLTLLVSALSSAIHGSLVSTPSAKNPSEDTNNDKILSGDELEQMFGNFNVQ